MNLNNKSIIVTGGAGFIGSHLVDRLISEQPKELIVCSNFFLGKESNLTDALRKFPKLKIVKVDVSDYGEMRQILEKYSVDIVFNLAVIPLPTSLEKPEWTFSENVNMTLNLCKLAREDKFKSLIQFSSSEAYGSALYSPMDEQHPINPETPYAASKAATDHLAFSYGRTFGIDVKIIRPFNNYGPRQNWGNYAGIIPLSIKRILENAPLTIFGDGLQTRDYIFVTDTAEAAVAISKTANARNKVINVGTGQEITVLNLLKLIADKMNYKKEFIFKEARPGDVRRHIADTKLLKKLTGFEPKVKIEEGIKKTIDWYKANIPSK
ncbi:MAG: GDP-mannose 4,6-dehydratase [Firmicutes bacterium]|nr:GDP-mannose 4,6-dehydratase [Bacillota bacterium]